MNAPLTISVNGCARCGEDHEQAAFKAFLRPVEDDDGTIWSHWAVCPSTGDPILLRSRPT